MSYLAEEMLFGILKFLPMRSDLSEAKYIKYLSDSFDKLSNKINDSDISDGFAIIPFHLLFMTALHYRALRIFKDQPENYRLAMTLKNKTNENQAIFDPSSPFDFSLFGESEVLNFFKLVGCENDKLGKIKSLIKERNNLAHASGNTEINPEKKMRRIFEMLGGNSKIIFKIKSVIC